LRRLAKKGRASKDVYDLLGYVYAEQGQYEKSVSAYLKGLESDSSDAATWHTLGYLYDMLKAQDKAIQAFAFALERNPEDASAHNYIGYAYAEQGRNLDEALQHVQKALELEPDNSYFRDSLGWVYFKLGRLEDAAGELEKASVGVEEPIIYEHLGDVYKEMGRSEAAKEQYNRALELDPENKQLKAKLKAIR
jgi:tetratricopeptide (TPR) repeat protein